mmetsp:Transcript_54326/g.96573  ORF Transcript_54326/g.96573 Transcript_54326/m.96573 type:complete len:333 (+) Transcript_54326:1149-2147(+)
MRPPRRPRRRVSRSSWMPRRPRTRPRLLSGLLPTTGLRRPPSRVSSSRPSARKPSPSSTSRPPSLLARLLKWLPTATRRTRLRRKPPRWPSRPPSSRRLRHARPWRRRRPPSGLRSTTGPRASRSSVAPGPPLTPPHRTSPRQSKPKPWRRLSRLCGPRRRKRRLRGLRPTTGPKRKPCRAPLPTLVPLPRLLMPARPWRLLRLPSGLPNTLRRRRRLSPARPGVSKRRPSAPAQSRLLLREQPTPMPCTALRMRQPRLPSSRRSSRLWKRSRPSRLPRLPGGLPRTMLRRQSPRDRSLMSVSWLTGQPRGWFAVLRLRMLPKQPSRPGSKS